MIFNIFSPKNLAKILAFFARTTASFFVKILIITLVFEKNANLFAENWQKSQKIVIITSTPDFCGLGSGSGLGLAFAGLTTLLPKQVGLKSLGFGI
jgi:predicted sugar kinase